MISNNNNILGALAARKNCSPAELVNLHDDDEVTIKKYILYDNN